MNTGVGQAVTQVASSALGKSKAATTSAMLLSAILTGYPRYVGTTQASMMVTTDALGKTIAVSSQTSMMVSRTALAKTTTETSLLAMLVAYRTGSIENLEARTWEFTLDGHTFYVLTLGEQGTFVYDFSTRQWAQWITGGLNTWNMEIGTTWKGVVVAADQSNPIIWQLTPSSFIDDGFKTMKRVVTGGLFVRQRQVVPNYAFRITASVGSPEFATTIPATVPEVALEFSDDQGKTFTGAGALTLVMDDQEQELAWMSLGAIKAPLRVFRVTDIGGIASIYGADAEVEVDEDRD